MLAGHGNIILLVLISFRLYDLYWGVLDTDLNEINAFKPNLGRSCPIKPERKCPKRFVFDRNFSSVTVYFSYLGVAAVSVATEWIALV